MHVLGFPDYKKQTERFATALNATYQIVQLHRFPDSESLVTLPSEPLPEQVLVCRSLNQPNDKLIELLLLTSAARERGVKTLILVAPYLCYMRQDKAFHPGEVISQKVIGRLLGDLFDGIMTVDPHLHRTHSLSAAIPRTSTVVLTATRLMGDFIQSQLSNPLLIGPDSESEQWVRAIAQSARLDYAVANKQRLGDDKVCVNLPRIKVQGREIVLVDDIISTGQTIVKAAKQLLNAGAKKVHCLVTHAIFSAGAEQQLQQAGIANIWSTDSINHHSNVISLADLLTTGVRNFN
jgi:ribose-phosphate pyrophosphokinase